MASFCAHRGKFSRGKKVQPSIKNANSPHHSFMDERFMLGENSFLFTKGAERGIIVSTFGFSNGIGLFRGHIRCEYG